MFLLRSAFWLTLMVVLIAPKDGEFGNIAGDASQQVLQLGRHAVMQQVLGGECASLECTGSKAAIAVLSGNQIPSPVVIQPTADIPVPLPRPRPDQMG